MKLRKIKSILRVLTMLVCPLFLQNLMACGDTNCETVTQYQNELEYQVNGVYLSEYDVNDDNILLSESVLEDFQATFSRYILEQTPLDNYYGQELKVSATTNDGYDFTMYLIIGELFDTLDLNESVNDSSADYIGFSSFRLYDAPEESEYEADPEITVTLMSDGHHVFVTIYPYTPSNSEVVYDNTLQVEAVFDNIQFVGETNVSTSEYCESAFGD